MWVPGDALGKAKAAADLGLRHVGVGACHVEVPRVSPLGTARILWLSWFGPALVLAAFASGGLSGVRCGSRACRCVRRLARRDVPFDRPRSKTILADAMPTAQHSTQHSTSSTGSTVCCAVLCCRHGVCQNPFRAGPVEGHVSPSESPYAMTGSRSTPHAGKAPRSESSQDESGAEP